MTDPITLGMLVAGALSVGAEAGKAAIGEVVKDAYGALKSKVAAWASSDVAELEKNPTSNARKAIIAEVINDLPAKEQEELRDLAQTLTRKIREAGPAVGVDIGRLEGLQVELGNVTVTDGVGVRIREAKMDRFKTGDINVGPSPGKP